MIATLHRNSRDVMVTVSAANKIGVRTVLMNTGFAGPQLADVCAREHVGCILVDDCCATTSPDYVGWDLDVPDHETPAEIETVLHDHPAVQDCAVFGVPDGANGEAVVAAVATHSSAETTEVAAELVARVDAKLASYKRLNRVIFVPDIPRLPSGKVLRRVLKESYGCTSDS